jgi:hypothetical protein
LRQHPPPRPSPSQAPPPFPLRVASALAACEPACLEPPSTPRAWGDPRWQSLANQLHHRLFCFCFSETRWANRVRAGARGGGGGGRGRGRTGRAAAPPPARTEPEEEQVRGEQSAQGALRKGNGQDDRQGQGPPRCTRRRAHSHRPRSRILVFWYVLFVI